MMSLIANMKSLASSKCKGLSAYSGARPGLHWMRMDRVSINRRTAAVSCVKFGPHLYELL